MAKRKPPKLPNGKPMEPNKVYDSWRKGKKKAVYACDGDKCKLLHFGEEGFSDYTLHKDPKRRASYIARHSAIKLKNGKPAVKDKLQPAYWALKVLW
jgi:hypothetical protein